MDLKGCGTARCPWKRPRSRAHLLVRLVPEQIEHVRTVVDAGRNIGEVRLQQRAPLHGPGTPWASPDSSLPACRTRRALPPSARLLPEHDSQMQHLAHAQHGADAEILEVGEVALPANVGLGRPERKGPSHPFAEFAGALGGDARHRDKARPDGVARNGFDGGAPPSRSRRGRRHGAA